MANKSFLEIFKRYEPSGECRALLERAKDTKVRYARDPMRVEVELWFDTHEDAELIYEIEDGCKTLYEAQVFKILPHFNPDVYSVG